MFSKFKEKLKEKLSWFSKKATEEVEEKAPLPPKQEQPIVKNIVKKKEEKKKEQPIKSRGISPDIGAPDSQEKGAPSPPELKVQQAPLELLKSRPEEKREVEPIRSLPAPPISPAIEPQRQPEPVPPSLSQKEAVPVKPEQPEKKSFFGKLKQAFTTKTISAEKFDELFWELELVLLENNMSVEVIDKIKAGLRKELVDKPLPRDVEGKIQETLKETLSEILSLTGPDILHEVKKKKPYIIAFFGINGAGKTTSIAKLAAYFQKNKHSVVMAAGDTFRAAAIQQLEEHGQKLGMKVISQKYGSDPAAVAYDAIKYAEKNGVEVVLIDTAGRLHSNSNLMAELEKVIRVAKPDLKIFVGESITGNDCIEQARRFNDLVELDGVILTKADVDEKGGAPLSIAYTIKKPILFLGVGQRYEDLEVFEKEKILERLGL